MAWPSFVSCEINVWFYGSIKIIANSKNERATSPKYVPNTFVRERAVVVQCKQLASGMNGLRIRIAFAKDVEKLIQ